MDIPDFEEDAKNVVKPVFKWIAGAQYGYVKGYSDCVEKEVKPLRIELSNYAYQIDRAKRDRDIAEREAERLKQEIERLKAAKP